MIATRAVLALFLTACTSRAPAASRDTTAVAERSAPRTLPTLPSATFLRHIPADTPYVFVHLWPVSRDHATAEYLAPLAALAPIAAGIAPAVQAKLPLALRLQLALLAELAAAPTADALAAVGADPATRGVVYAIGMAPVVRIELSDAGQFAPFLARVLARAGGFERRASRGQTYHAAVDGDATWIIAVRDAHLIVAALPSPAAHDIDLVTGARLPARSLADDTARLAAAAADAGVPAAARPAVGSIDTAAAAAALAAGMPAPCGDEVAALATLAPRVSLAARATRGRDGLLRHEVRSLFETRDDVTAALAALEGDVPGATPDADLSAAASIALAIDVPALLVQLSRALDAIGARPYRCPTLAWLTTLATRERLVVQAMAGTSFARIRGVSLFLLLEPGAPLTSLGAVGFVGSAHPAVLLAALAARLGLHLPAVEPGAPPVEVTGSLLPLGPLHVALGDRAVGFSLGGHARELGEMLGLSTPADRPLALLRTRTAQLTALLDTMGPPDADPRVALADADLAARLAAVDRHALDRHEELEVIARATERGLAVEVRSRYAVDTRTRQ